MIEFTIPTIPIAQPRQRHRVVTNGGRLYSMNYTPTRHPVNHFKATAQLAATEAYSGPPLDGPVVLLAVFVLPRPKAKVWRTKPMPREPHITKPDVENLAKSLFDSLTGIVWRDDRQVWHCVLEKCIASGDEQPHVRVKVVPWANIIEKAADASQKSSKPEMRPSGQPAKRFVTRNPVASGGILEGAVRVVPGDEPLDAEAESVLTEVARQVRAGRKK